MAEKQCGNIKLRRLFPYSERTLIYILCFRKNMQLSDLHSYNIVFLVLYYFLFFFQLLYLESGFFYFQLTLRQLIQNLSSFLGLSQVTALFQVLNRHLSKFGLQSSWITDACHYTQPTIDVLAYLKSFKMLEETRSQE